MSSLQASSVPVQPLLRTYKRVSNAEPRVSNVNVPVEGAVHRSTASPTAAPPQLPVKRLGVAGVVPVVTDGPTRLPTSRAEQVFAPTSGERGASGTTTAGSSGGGPTSLGIQVSVNELP